MLEPSIAIGVQRYTECEINCNMVMKSQRYKKLPQSVPIIGEISVGITIHRIVLITASETTASDAGMGDTESLTTRLRGGNATPVVVVFRLPGRGDVLELAVV
jgi:hypothetical protein